MKLQDQLNITLTAMVALVAVTSIIAIIMHSTAPVESTTPVSTQQPTPICGNNHVEQGEDCEPSLDRSCNNDCTKT